MGVLEEIAAAPDAPSVHAALVRARNQTIAPQVPKMTLIKACQDKRAKQPALWTPEVADAFRALLQSYSAPVYPVAAYEGQQMPPDYLFNVPVALPVAETPRTAASAVPGIAVAAPAAVPGVPAAVAVAAPAVAVAAPAVAVAAPAVAVAAPAVAVASAPRMASAPATLLPAGAESKMAQAVATPMAAGGIGSVAAPPVAAAAAAVAVAAPAAAGAVV